MKKPKNERKKTKKSKILDRHRLLLKTISDNIRSGMTAGEAMKLVGYSESYSETPGTLKETEAWQELVRTEIKDEKLVKKLNYLLDHEEWRAVDAGLDKAFKIKGKYAPVGIEIKRKRTIREIEDDIARTLSEIGEFVR